MFVETEVLRSTAPICSAIDMKRLPKTSSRIGIGLRARPSAAAAISRLLRRRRRRVGSLSDEDAARRPPSSAAKPGSTTTVPVSSSTSAGPTICVPGQRGSSRANGPASPNWHP